MSCPTDSAEPTDDDVRRACAGDERAVATLWRHYQPALLRYARSLGHHDAEDIASAVWISLAKALPALEHQDVESFRRVLFTIARRRLIDEFRRRDRSPTSVQIAEGDAITYGEGDELGQAIAYLQLLPPAQAEVIVLRVIVGMSAEEVGSMTGQTAGAVRVMCHRGLGRLRQLLEPEVGRRHQPSATDVTNHAVPAMDRA